MENRLDAAPKSPTQNLIHVDTTNFRNLVQKLTGLAGDAENRRLCSKPVFSGDDSIRPRKSPFKLQERRNHAIRKLEIKLGLTSLRNSPPETKRYKFESPISSPATPLSEFQFFPSSGTESPSSSSVSVEEKGLYLNPSPLNTPRGSDPPKLLTLFPLSSPGQKFQ